MSRRSASRPSLATVAAALAISTATVSNVFNRPEKVTAALRDRVLAEAERQGYAGPDPAARQLSRGRTDTLGLLFTGELSYAFHDPAAIAFLEGLSRSCQGAGLNLLIIAGDAAGGNAPSSAVGNAVVDGFVAYSVPDDDPNLHRVLERQLPTVVVESPRNLPGVDWVGPDDRDGVRRLGEYLLQLGHRRIGAISASGSADRRVGPADARWSTMKNSVTRERLLGLKDALDVAGIDDFPVELCATNTTSAGADAFTALLDRRPDLTAVCGLMDVLALGALGAAARRGLSVPGDLTITGFDDIPGAAAAGLTTVSQPLVDKGRIAGDLFLSHRPGSPARRRLLPTTLQVRASSGPPRD